MTDELSLHETAVSDYYTEETALYIQSWDERHFHFGIFEPGELQDHHQHPTQVPALNLALRRMIGRVTSPASIGAGTRVVDAGCGVGGTAFELAERHGARVTGVNICRSQLEIAERRRAQSEVASRVDFVWGDCSVNLPFEDASVDVVTNLESACHYSDREHFLSECFRVLVPGGRLVAMDWVERDGLRDAERDASIGPVCAAWHIVSLESPGSYRERVVNAGFEVIEEERLGDEVLPNAQLFERGARELEGLSQIARLPEDKLRLMHQFDVLSRAWLSGDFCLYRYVAEKPHPGGPT